MHMACCSRLADSIPAVTQTELYRLRNSRDQIEEIVGEDAITFCSEPYLLREHIRFDMKPRTCAALHFRYPNRACFQVQLLCFNKVELLAVHQLPGSR
ncbi:hypothetical protein D3C78_1607750 [compost metagenome]